MNQTVEDWRNYGEDLTRLNWAIRPNFRRAMSWVFLGDVLNKPEDTERAKRWMHSELKRKWEAGLGLIGAGLTRRMIDYAVEKLLLNQGRREMNTI